MSIETIPTRNPAITAHIMTMQDGANVSLIVTDECAIAVDLPMQASELADWRAGMAAVTSKPLRWIVFTSPERVSADTLKLLAPVEKPAPKVIGVPTIIQDAGFAQLYAALESAQPRSPEPLTAFELRKRGILPEFTFSEKMTLTSGNPPVHTDILHVDGVMPGSAFVFVREAGLVFVGDHIAANDPPVLYANSNLDHWIDALAEIQREKKVTIVVPGGEKFTMPARLPSRWSFEERPQRPAQAGKKPQKPRCRVWAVCRADGDLSRQKHGRNANRVWLKRLHI